MSSPETRTQPFDMVPEDEPRQRRGSMVDDATFGDMREGRRGSDGSDTEHLPLNKNERRMYASTGYHYSLINNLQILQDQRMGRLKNSSFKVPES